MNKGHVLIYRGFAFFKGRKSFALLLSAIAFLFMSCDDDNIAKSMEGSWQGQYVVSSDGEDEDNVTQTLSFTYIEDDVKSGGNFTEEHSGHMKDVDCGTGTLDCIYHCSINGTWEIIAGDLYIYYNVPSLKVNINRDDVKFNYYNEWDALDEIDYSISTLTDLRGEMIRELKKSIYREMLNEYKTNDPDAPYRDVKVSERTLSFITNDAGTVELERIR